MHGSALGEKDPEVQVPQALVANLTVARLLVDTDLDADIKSQMIASVNHCGVNVVIRRAETRITGLIRETGNSIDSYNVILTEAHKRRLRGGYID